MADDRSGAVQGLADAWAANVEAVHEFASEIAADLSAFVDQEGAAVGDVFADELAAFEAAFWLP